MQNRTDCGARYEHDRHPYENGDGLIEMCDGSFNKAQEKSNAT